MTKIKYIHCLGTSYTAGAGFEFDSYIDHVKVYEKSTLNIELKKENFSYPGQLQNMIGDSVIVNNLGKNGFGDEKLIRHCYDITSSPDFNSAEHLFLLEFSGLGRKELFSNTKNDYFIFNYDYKAHLDDTFISYKGGSFDYLDDNEEDTSDFENSFLNFFKKSFSAKNEIYQMEKNNSILIGYMEYMKCNYFCTVSPWASTKIDNSNFRQNRIIIFGDGKYLKTAESMVNFNSINNLLITDETGGKITNGHHGYIGNKIVAQTIYNKLLDFNYIDGLPIDIDYININIF